MKCERKREDRTRDPITKIWSYQFGAGLVSLVSVYQGIYI